AQASVPVRADTAVSVFPVADGSTVGTVTHPVAALAVPAVSTATAAAPSITPSRTGARPSTRRLARSRSVRSVLSVLSVPWNIRVLLGWPDHPAAGGSPVGMYARPEGVPMRSTEAPLSMITESLGRHSYRNFP